MNRPEGKVAVVTGGIRAFAREGARVAFSGTSEKSLSNLASSAGTDCRGFVADLSDPASPQQLVDAALQAFGLHGPDAIDQRWRIHELNIKGCSPRYAYVPNSASMSPQVLWENSCEPTIEHRVVAIQ
jgi:NAD(P)-dependent dehydrogenase (short-subunit alcohol dehydrogenase family)